MIPSQAMRKLCFYHAGCPDGFGAAWAVWRAWGEAGEYRPIGHHDVVEPSLCDGALVAFVDIAPPNASLRSLGRVAAQLAVLDHHVTSRDRFHADADLEREVRAAGHHVEFDLGRSGAILAWDHFHEEDPPALLEYVQDQDLWAWKLPDSEAVNAAVGSYERTFEVWDALAARPAESLATEGAPLVRAGRIEVARALQRAHAVTVADHPVEAVNSTAWRSAIGHALSERAAYRRPWGCVYRVQAGRVDATLYSIGDLDVAEIAAALGGGGHRNAAGFSVPLATWLADFVH